MKSAFCPDVPRFLHREKKKNEAERIGMKGEQIWKKILIIRMITYNFDDSDASSFYDDNPEKTEKDNAREVMSKYIPKNVKDIIGNEKKYPDYAMMHGAFKPYHKVYYDKNGNPVNPFNESRLQL